MTIAADLYAALQAAAGVTALLGSGDAIRLYPAIAPAGTATPYAVWQHIAAQPATTHNEPTGNQHDYVQVACFAGTWKEATDLRAAIVAALDDVPLTASGPTPVLQDERSEYDTAVELHRADADFLI